VRAARRARQAFGDQHPASARPLLGPARTAARPGRSAGFGASRVTEASPWLGNQARRRLVESRSSPFSSRGDPLSLPLRHFFEPRVGRDLSAVRVHTGHEAGASARALGAQAFTIGNDVAFGHGQYDPDSGSGRRLIAHELSHVIQQDGGRPRIQRKCGPVATPPDCPGVTVDAAAAPVGPRFAFAINCDDFVSGEREKLEAMANPATIPAGSDVDIIGMASSDGNADLNASLSCRRARAAADALRATPGFAGNIRLIQSSGGVSGTDNNPAFRAAEVIVSKKAAPAQDPVFRIDGVPKASAVEDTREVSTTFQSVQFMGDFELDARVGVQTAQPSDADDWQVGVVQTVASPIHQTCFRFPRGVTPPPGHLHPREVFVGNMKQLPGFLVADRNDTDPNFMTRDTRTDLKGVHGGRAAFSVPLHAEDHPRTGQKNSLIHVTREPDDSRAQLFHQHRFGFMLTHVIARQISSARVIPLHTVEWVMFIDVDYDPSPGSGFPPTSNVRSRRFELRANRPFSSSDVPPLVGGKAINEFNEQEGDWKPFCPRL
jgi:hypothetical protein